MIVNCHNMCKIVRVDVIMRLDKIDILILNNLQKNGRITNVELANNVGISPPPCLRRLKKLENNGVILGYHAEINSVLMGYNFSAVCLISLEKQTQKLVEKFFDYIQGLHNVRECLSITGDFDCFLKIIAKDISDFEKFLDTCLKNHENISQIKVYVTMKSNKSEKGIPLPQTSNFSFER